MDQDAFRSLLATPARSSDQGRSPSSRAPTSSRFGIAPPKRLGALAQSSSKDLATDLKPRKVTKPKRNPDGSLYRDRAAERRAGRDGDFADAEKLLEVCVSARPPLLVSFTPGRIRSRRPLADRTLNRARKPPESRKMSSKIR